jgi:hypothetical protein
MDRFDGCGCGWDHDPSSSPYCHCSYNCGDDSYDPFFQSCCGYGCNWDYNDS